MNIYDLAMNKFILPHAYEDWQDYRSSITEHILRIGLHIDHPTLAILGAGRCNDIDLPACTKVFENIHMIDIDANAMREVKESLPITEQNRVQTHEFSLSGLMPDDISNLCNSILEYVRHQGYSLSQQEYQAYVAMQLTHLQNGLFRTASDLLPILPHNSYDLVVCLGVHSQLYSMLAYCLESLDNNISQQLFQGEFSCMDICHRILNDMIDITVPVLNSAILDSAKAYAIIGCEYDEERPVAGAYQSIRDIKNRPLLSSKVTESHLPWNFNPANKIIYNMLIQTISTTV